MIIFQVDLDKLDISENILNKVIENFRVGKKEKNYWVLPVSHYQNVFNSKDIDKLNKIMIRCMNMGYFSLQIINNKP